MKKKGLVVDDDLVMLKFVAKFLTREGHEVQTAADGFAALNLLSPFTPDISFFDLIRPKLDGGKLLKIARSKPQLKNCYLVIILITDVTGRKRLEMQLQHVQKMEAIATMAAGVAHNFRNTLTEIRVNSQLIQMNYQDESRPNQGTTFKIHLPAASPEGPKQDTAPPAVVRGNGQCVLVVDDEPEILTAMEGLLDYLGYRPEFASSGKEGLEKYMQRKPEAVLMNINMPEMDGVACIEEIINYDPAANIAIISGYEEDGIDGLSAEVRNLIKEFRAKPLGLGDLSELLAAMFKER